MATTTRLAALLLPLAAVPLATAGDLVEATVSTNPPEAQITMDASACFTVDYSEEPPVVKFYVPCQVAAKE